MDDNFLLLVEETTIVRSKIKGEDEGLISIFFSGKDFLLKKPHVAKLDITELQSWMDDLDINSLDDFNGLILSCYIHENDAPYVDNVMYFGNEKEVMKAIK